MGETWLIMSCRRDAVRSKAKASSCDAFLSAEKSLKGSSAALHITCHPAPGTRHVA